MLFFCMRLLFTIFVILTSIPIAFSWGWTTHEWFCEQIYNKNHDLQQKLDKQEFLRGCIAPDKEYKDTRYHHCYVAKECKPIDITKTDPGGLPYFTDITSCKQEIYFDCPAMLKFEEAINNASKSDFSFYLGVATHYFTDSFVPVHQIMGEDYFTCHLPFENKIDKKLEADEKFWTVTQKCEIYFPCYKTGSTVRKCSTSYDVEIEFSYADVVEVLQKTDSDISTKLGMKEGEYSGLLRNNVTGFFTMLLNRILEFLNRVF